MSLKQPDGSFRVSKDSEVDIRFVYVHGLLYTTLTLFQRHVLSTSRRHASQLTHSNPAARHGGFREVLPDLRGRVRMREPAVLHPRRRTSRPPHATTAARRGTWRIHVMRAHQLDVVATIYRGDG